MKRIFIYFLFVFSFSLVGAKMIASTDFEHLMVGEPLSRPLFEQEGFQTGTWDNALATRTVIDSTVAASGVKSMRITYSKNGFGPEETGCQVRLLFDNRDEAYVSYYLRFSENFSWGTTSYGGKLPGLAGGDCCSGGASCDGTNGFSARLMWRTGGKGVLYLYHMDKPDTYGEDIDLVYPDGSPVIFTRGVWYHIAERVKINSDGSTYDGEVEIWVNGKQVLLRKGLRFTSNEDKVNDFYISTFHGGNDATWCPTETCYTWLDDIRIGTSYQDVSYQTCVKPNLGNDATLCTGAKSYTFSSDVHPSNARYTWLYEGKIVSSEPSLNALKKGEYVLVVDSDWCSMRDTVLLKDDLSPSFKNDEVKICASSFVTLDSRLKSDPSLSFEWEKDGCLLKENTSKLMTKDAGVYQLTVRSALCEPFVSQVTVVSDMLPVKDREGEEGESVTLQVDGSGDYAWYSDSSAVNLLQKGSKMDVAVQSSDCYYYVKDQSSFSGNVGKKHLSANAYTRSNFDTEWMLFDVERQLTIDSVSIYPTKDLTAVIRVLKDETAEVVSVMTFEGLHPGENRLPLGVTLAPGRYRMDAKGTTAPLYHSHTDDDIRFPYSENGLISIVGSNVAWINNKPWYLFFYDWKITSGNTCAPTPVLVKNLSAVTVEDATKRSAIDVYPRFTDGELNVDGIVGKGNLSVFSIGGKKIISLKCRQPHAYLNVGSWKPGVYLLVIEDQQGRSVFRFMKI